MCIVEEIPIFGSFSDKPVAQSLYWDFCPKMHSKIRVLHDAAAMNRSRSQVENQVAVFDRSYRLSVHTRI